MLEDRALRPARVRTSTRTLPFPASSLAPSTLGGTCGGRGLASGAHAARPQGRTLALLRPAPGHSRLPHAWAGTEVTEAGLGPARTASRPGPAGDAVQSGSQVWGWR